MLLKMWHKVLDKLQLYSPPLGITTGILYFFGKQNADETLEDDLVPRLNCVGGI
jgi:hypothetical protein